RGHWQWMCVQVRKIFKQEAMGETISSTNTPQQDASSGIIEESDIPPGGRCAPCLPKPETQDIVLHNSTQPAEQPEKQPAGQRARPPDGPPAGQPAEQPAGQSEEQSEE